MSYKVIPVPAFVLSDAQLLQIATALQEVENELFDERGPCTESRKAVELLLDELNDRATARFFLQDGKIVRG